MADLAALEAEVARQQAPAAQAARQFAQIVASALSTPGTSPEAALSTIAEALQSFDHAHSHHTEKDEAPRREAQAGPLDLPTQGLCEHQEDLGDPESDSASMAGTGSGSSERSGPRQDSEQILAAKARSKLRSLKAEAAGATTARKSGLKPKH